MSTLLKKLPVAGRSPFVVSSNDNYLLQLTTDSASVFFVSHNSFRNGQVDYSLDLSNFDGEVKLVSHVQDDQQLRFCYPYFRLDGSGTVIIDSISMTQLN